MQTYNPHIFLLVYAIGLNVSHDSCSLAETGEYLSDILAISKPCKYVQKNMHENMLKYLSLDIIFSLKLTVFFRLCS